MSVCFTLRSVTLQASCDVGTKSITKQTSESLIEILCSMRITRESRMGATITSFGDSLRSFFSYSCSNWR